MQTTAHVRYIWMHQCDWAECAMWPLYSKELKRMTPPPTSWALMMTALVVKEVKREFLTDLFVRPERDSG